MITIEEKGDYKVVTQYLNRLKTQDVSHILNKYGNLGVNALSNATPKESGQTAASWSYSIVQRRGYSSIRWHNSHIEDGVNIAVILQYGHGTRNGGYVQGRDYIMPAMRSIFDQIAEEAWREVTRV